MNLGHIISRGFQNVRDAASKLPKMPGSAQSLQEAGHLNKWSHPFGKDANSMDVFLGGKGHPASSEQPWARTVGRTVGSYFGGSALGNLFGGSSGSSLGNSAGRAIPGMINRSENSGTNSAGGQQQSGGPMNIFDFAGGGGGGGGGGMGGNPLGNIIGMGGGGYMNNRNQQNLMNLANQAAQAGNTMNDPHRTGFQGQLNDLFSPGGAQTFMDTDPIVQAQKRSIGDSMQANFAKSGNLPLNAIMGSSQLANAFGNQFNQRIGDLTVLGGYNQGNPYGGAAYSNLINPMNTNQNNMGGGMMSMLGPMFQGAGKGLGNLFGMGGGGGGVDTSGMGNMGMDSIANSGGGFDFSGF